MRYLLDSNAWVVHLRNRNSEVTQRLGTHLASDILLCSVVLGELHFGVERSPIAFRSKNQALLDDVRRQYQSLPFDDRAAIEYGNIRADLTTRGLVIGGNDMQIAAIARTHGLTLVTHNTAEFSRVPGLVLEDWQIP